MENLWASTRVGEETGDKRDKKGSPVIPQNGCGPSRAVGPDTCKLHYCKPKINLKLQKKCIEKKNTFFFFNGTDQFTFRQNCCSYPRGRPGGFQTPLSLNGTYYEYATSNLQYLFHRAPKISSFIPIVKSWRFPELSILRYGFQNR